MLAAYEPKIHSFSKCVPSVLVSGGVVLGSEHAGRTRFCLHVSVGSLWRLQLPFLHMLLPIPRETPITAAPTTCLVAESAVSGRPLRPWWSFASPLKDTCPLSCISFSSPWSLSSAHSCCVFHCQPCIVL